MCRAFSCIVGSDKQVTWKLGIDSHTDLLKLTTHKDITFDPKAMTFARVEIVPSNGNYLTPDFWTLHIDQAITPAWWSSQYESLAWTAHQQWLTELNQILIYKPIVHPFKLTPPKEITQAHIKLLKLWASVWASVWDSVGASVWVSVGASVWDSVRASVWDSVRDSVGASVWVSVGASVRDSVGASVWVSVGASVWDSVRASVWVYISSFFNIPDLQKFQSCIDLWNQGLVPSFDGTTWRLHGGPKAEILFSISKKDLNKG